MHPSLPQADVMRIYYADYAKDFPMLTRATWGYTVETATLAIRLVLSGVFEKYPKLKIILGYLGETLPFLVWRVDTTLKRPCGKAANFREIFCNNFYVTTSGNFSNPALLCCVMEMGIDRILFAVDWLFVPNPPATKWMESVPLCDEDKAKILRQRQAAPAHVNDGPSLRRAIATKRSSAKSSPRFPLSRKRAEFGFSTHFRVRGNPGSSKPRIPPLPPPYPRSHIHSL